MSKTYDLFKAAIRIWNSDGRRNHELNTYGSIHRSWNEEAYKKLFVGSDPSTLRNAIVIWRRRRRRHPSTVNRRECDENEYLWGPVAEARCNLRGDTIHVEWVPKGGVPVQHRIPATAEALAELLDTHIRAS